MQIKKNFNSCNKIASVTSFFLLRIIKKLNNCKTEDHMGTYYHNRSKCIGACRVKSGDSDNIVALTTPTEYEAAELALIVPTLESSLHKVAADAIG